MCMCFKNHIVSHCKNWIAAYARSNSVIWEIFARIIFSQIALKDIFATLKIRGDVKNSRQRHDLPSSVNDTVFMPFRGVHFHETSHMRSFAKINPRENFRIYSIS